MLKPSGYSASSFDLPFLVYEWAHHLHEANDSNQYPPMIFSGIGKPSYVLNKDLVLTAKNYWDNQLKKIMSLEQRIQKVQSPQELTDLISSSGTVVDYSLSSGDNIAKTQMAFALKRWYGEGVNIKSIDVMFTVGGIAGLSMLFRFLKENCPDGKIITPVPYYPYYNSYKHHHELHTINLMDKPGLSLQAEFIQQAINDLRSQGTPISAFLFCDPYNPLGTVIGENGWKEIASVLRKTPKEIPIILDEAYAELCLYEKHNSLLTIAPDLQDRLIILRSATKSLSASGERMAILLIFNEIWRERLIDESHYTYGHSPVSLQRVYANALFNFNEEKRLNLSQYYKTQVNYVEERLKNMDAALNIDAYKVQGAFYVIADLSKLLYQPIPGSAQRALGKNGMITTDEDLCYSLLFQDRIMLSPLSYYGVDPKLGYLRITCTGGITLLAELMDRLEKRLLVIKK